jgi:hypothetical protein
MNWYIHDPIHYFKGNIKMKKIVISALLMGLVGLTHAQTISGTMRYDVKQAEGAAATSGIAKSEIVINATEDLGGGMKVTAKMGLNGNGRGETVAGTDATIAISGGFGTVTVGQLEIVNGIIDRGYAGAPVIGTDGSVLASPANKDMIKYALPAIGGFTVAVSGIRDVDATTARTYTLGVSGAVAGIDTGIDYTKSTKRVRASASTKVMGLTVGAGWSRGETNTADSHAFGVSMPIGSLTVGAARSSGDGRSNEFGASYAFSKRTSIAYAYQTVSDNSTSAKNIATSRVRLQHKF